MTRQIAAVSDSPARYEHGCSPTLQTLLHAVMLDEIARVVTAGDSPRVEGIALVGRAVEVAGLEAVAATAINACGPAPTMVEVGAAVASGETPYEWAYRAAWLSLLPSAAHGEWSAPAAALIAEYSLGRETAAGVVRGGRRRRRPIHRR